MGFDALENDVTEAAAKDLLPADEGFRLFKDAYNGRWRAYHRVHGSISRSWSRRSSKDAMREVLQWVWNWSHTMRGRLCPIEGLLLADDDDD